MRSWIIAVVAVSVAALAAIDLGRSCDSLLWQLALDAIALIDSETADSLWLKTSLKTSHTPVAVLRGSATPPLDVPDPFVNLGDEWLNVQSGNVTLVAPLDLVILTKPYWAKSLDAFVAEVLAKNPQLQRAEAPYVAVPHLLYQIGGGVEGLETQILVAETGQAWVWRVDRSKPGFPAAQPLNISVPSTLELFSLAREAELGRLQETSYHCGVQDGRTISLVLIETDTVGRVSYVTNAEPVGPVADLLQLLAAEIRLDPVRILTLKNAGSTDGRCW